MARRKPKALIEKILETANATSVASAAKKWRVRPGQIYAWRKKTETPTTATAKTMLASGQLQGRRKFPQFKTTIPDDVNHATLTLPEGLAINPKALQMPMDANGQTYEPCPVDVPQHVLREKRLEETNFLLREKIKLLSRINEIDNALLRV